MRREGLVHPLKFFNDQFDVYLPQMKDGQVAKLLIVGDLHYHEHAPKTIFKTLLINAAKIAPDFIVIPGDIVETSKFIDIPREREFFEFMLKELSNIAPVIISAGNHEIANFDTDINRSFTPKTMSYLESLNQYPNIHFLHNSQVTFGDITFTGFTPGLDYYFNYNSENSGDISREEYAKSNLKMDPNQFNILLSHVVPKEFADKDITDLTIAAHWHDGLIPKALDRFFDDTDNGIFFENFPSKRSTSVEYARGVSEFGRGYVISSQGYRKNTADIFIFNLLERIAANDVETATIHSGPKRLVKTK